MPFQQQPRGVQDILVIVDDQDAALENLRCHVYEFAQVSGDVYASEQ